MTMPQINTDLFEAKLDRATPGESLTNDPDAPYSFEKPPEFTTIHAASEYIFERVTDEDNYMQFLKTVTGGASLMEITKVISLSSLIKTNGLKLILTQVKGIILQK